MELHITNPNFEHNDLLTLTVNSNRQSVLLKKRLKCLEYDKRQFMADHRAAFRKIDVERNRLEVQLDVMRAKEQIEQEALRKAREKIELEQERQRAAHARDQRNETDVIPMLKKLIAVAMKHVQDEHEEDTPVEELLELQQPPPPPPPPPPQHTVVETNTAFDYHGNTIQAIPISHSSRRGLVRQRSEASFSVASKASTSSQLSSTTTGRKSSVPVGKPPAGVVHRVRAFSTSSQNSELPTFSTEANDLVGPSKLSLMSPAAAAVAIQRAMIKRDLSALIAKIYPENMEASSEGSNAALLSLSNAARKGSGVVTDGSARQQEIRPSSAAVNKDVIVRRLAPVVRKALNAAATAAAANEHRNDQIANCDAIGADSSVATVSAPPASGGLCNGDDDDGLESLKTILNAQFGAVLAMGWYIENLS